MASRPGLRRYVFIPLLANIVIFCLISWFLYHLFSNINAMISSLLPEWLQFLSWLMTPILWIIGGLTTGYFSTLVVLLLTSPFHSLLAEKVEEIVTGEYQTRSTKKTALVLDLCKSALREVKKLTYYMPMALGMIFLSIMPLLNSLSPISWFLFGAWMMSLQFIDYPMDNHQLPFREVRDACGAKRLTTLGFGATVALFTGIPFMNLAVIPAAVIGATLLWCEELRDSSNS